MAPLTSKDIQTPRPRLVKIFMLKLSSYDFGYEKYAPPQLDLIVHQSS